MKSVLIENQQLIPVLWLECKLTIIEQFLSRMKRTYLWIEWHNSTNITSITQIINHSKYSCLRVEFKKHSENSHIIIDHNNEISNGKIRLSKLIHTNYDQETFGGPNDLKFNSITYLLTFFSFSLISHIEHY